MTTAKDIPSDHKSMHWETEYELEQENNQMTNFLHLKINKGNNNLTLSIYHKAVETDTPILSTSNHLEENKKVTYRYMLNRTKQQTDP
jgi:hypothetical protein